MTGRPPHAAAHYKLARTMGYISGASALLVVTSAALFVVSWLAAGGLGLIACAMAGALAFWAGARLTAPGETGTQNLQWWGATSSFQAFEREMERALAQALRSGARASVLCIAIDDTKDLEAGLGKEAVVAGQAEIISRLRSHTRQNEPLFELENGYLAMVLIGAPHAQDDTGLARRLLEDFEHLIELGSERVRLSLSIGISRQTHDASSGLLLRQAEVALHEARRKGGTHYCVFEHGMEDVLSARPRIAQDLVEAVRARQGLTLVYQPVFDIEKTDMEGAEALLRWNHPVYGRLDTRVLIEIAEEQGIIAELGEWILETAVSRLARSKWPWLAVNVSAHQLESGAFANHVARTLEQANISASRLHLDLPLKSLISPASKQPIDALSALGVNLVVDAEETPHEVAALLDRPTALFTKASKLKLSGEAIWPPDAGFVNEAALWRLARSARTQGVMLAAKNIETGAQHDVLKRIGFEQVQGHFYAPPTTALTVETLAAYRRAG